MPNNDLNVGLGPKVPPPSLGLCLNHGRHAPKSLIRAPNSVWASGHWVTDNLRGKKPGLNNDNGLP